MISMYLLVINSVCDSMSITALLVNAWVLYDRNIFQKAWCLFHSIQFLPILNCLTDLILNVLLLPMYLTLRKLKLYCNKF